MLKHRSELSDDLRFSAMMCGYVALCEQSGAYLIASGGRTHSGYTNYILVLPLKPVSERRSLFHDCQSSQENTRRIHAYTDDDAIQLANIRLERMLKKTA